MPQVNEVSWILQSLYFIVFLFFSFLTLSYLNFINSFYVNNICVKTFNFLFLI